VNANWNVVALAESDGDVVERYIYDAYGRATVLNADFTPKVSGTAYAWTHLYTGRELDPESGLMHYRNRYYHTGLGRFVSRDPIGYGGGINAYGYCANSPVDYVDPGGTKKGGGGGTSRPPIVHEPPPIEVGDTPVNITYVSDKSGYDSVEFWGNFWYSNYDLDSGDDFKPNQTLQEGQCIGSMLIIAHGGYNTEQDIELAHIRFADEILEYEYDSVYKVCVKNTLTPSFKNIAFCKECTLELRSCQIGSATGLKEKLEKVTGCKVTLHVLARCSSEIHRAGFVREFLTYVSPLQFRC